MKRIAFLLLLFSLLVSFSPETRLNPDVATRTVDICIYGGTSAGVIAAYSARKLGKSVLLIEPGRRLGGLSTGGLGYTDIGNKYAVTGLALNFYRQLGKHYGSFEQWVFEPHVAEATFARYIRQANVPVLYNHRLTAVERKGQRIVSISLETTASPRPGEPAVERVRANQFIDCSYEGDLMAKAGVRYTVGREANARYGETINGVQLMTGHQFPDGIDPYRVPGKPESGLLWGISAARLLPNGTGDQLVQAYNYRICLTNNPANRVPITRPVGYDSTRYDLLLRLMAASPQKRKLNDYFIWSRMPNGKTDINNRGGFSTDMIGTSHRYPEATYPERTAIIAEHERYTKGLLYFVGHDPRVPDELRREIADWGYPNDEYTDTGHWSPQLYVREARRMVGDYVMTQANCEAKAVVTDGVGMAAYTMDSHNCQRIVVEKAGQKMVKNEGNVEVGGFPPYPISYRALTPKAGECTNLLVPVCLSASHIAYGSIRMEPVFMVLGQATAVAASMAIDARTSVQGVNVAGLQKKLRDDPLLDGSTPDVVVDNDGGVSVTRTGDWMPEKKGGYGLSYWVDDTRGAVLKTMRFTPTLAKAGSYAVYAYVPLRPDASTQTTFRLYDGQQSQPVVLQRDQVQVSGQTSGAWVKLGQFALPAGRTAYVELTNQGADGTIVADAIQWVAIP